jgi:hypothetical protein
MRIHGSVSRFVLPFCLALSLSACLPESDDEQSTDEAMTSGVSLTITAPTNMSSMDTTDETVRVSGIASSDAGVFTVSWVNDKGSEGTATGTETWETGDIALAVGENRFTIIAEDTEGATAEKSITVNRESGEKGAATLSWNPPESRTDGTALTNLGGFKIYYGRMSGVYDYEIDIDNPSISTYLVEGLNAGDWYFVVAAYDADGLESEHSNEVLREII